MTRLALATVFTLTLLGTAAGQESPYGVPKPLGGPIVGLDGRVRTGLDAHPVPSPWNLGIDLGVSGSQGNTDTLKLRTGLDVRYDSPEDVAILNVMYILNQANRGELENKGFALLRNQLPLDEGFGWYAQAQLEYDEFRAIKLRAGSHSGIAFNAWQDADQLLSLRAGFGESRQWGGMAPTWVAEGQGGFDYEYRITSRTKVTATADYFPDVKNFASYRVRVRASFDILLDPETNVLLRIGAFDRYDSQPYGSKRNDLDYYMTLQFRF